MKLEVLRVPLPLPDRRMSPNARVHHMLLAKLRKEARALASRHLMGGTLPKKMPTHYRIEWFFKGRKPDSDNLAATCKAYLDGVADVLGVDDMNLEFDGVTRIHDKSNPHIVLVYLREVDPVQELSRPELADLLYRQIRQAVETFDSLDQQTHEWECLNITTSISNYLKAACSHASELVDNLISLENQ